MSSDEAFLEKLFLALVETGLDAVVVGMTAAALRGAPVMTEDVDLLLRETPRNRQTLKALRKRLGGLEVVKASELASIETLLGGEVPIDLIFDAIPGGLSFAGVKARSSPVQVGTATARVASLSDVIHSKQATNRPKDQAALPILRETEKALALAARRSAAT
jgi:hypothetical protein